MSRIDCTSCGRDFEPDAVLTERLRAARASGGDTGYITAKCPACGDETDVWIAEDAYDPPRPQFRCPRPACAGWALDTWGPGEPPYRCDLCFTGWDSRPALEKAIAEAVARFPHRARVYRHTAEGWQPVVEDDEPEDYEERVEREAAG